MSDAVKKAAMGAVGMLAGFAVSQTQPDAIVQYTNVDRLTRQENERVIENRRDAENRGKHGESGRIFGIF